jgi:hypothetical protein
MKVQLLTPIVLVVVPLLVAALKRAIPPGHAYLIPILATMLGAALDTLGQLVTANAITPGLGTAVGLASVGLREIVDQLRKASAQAPS